MTIDRISSIETIQPNRKPGGLEKTNRALQADTIDISPAAREKGEFYRAMEVVASAPDTRPERVEDIRRKLQDPSYIDDRIIQATADRIIDALWG